MATSTARETPLEGGQLTGLVKAKEPEPAKVPEDPTAAGPPPDWRNAADDVRSVVKWLVAAFAAVGAVMFAKGFVTTPALSWDSDRTQLIWAWLVGSLGVLALGWLIYQAVQMLRPAVYELSDLPTAYVNSVNANPRYYLPQDTDSFETFTAKLQALRIAEAKCRDRVAASEQALEEASKADPKSDGAVAAAQANLKSEKYTYDSIVNALKVYNRTRGQLLDRATYWKSSKGLDVSAGWMVTAAALAAAGGIGYQLLLATPPKPDSGAAASSAPVVGELIRGDNEAGTLLWNQLALTACQADAASARIPVVVSGGKGTVADPYVVSTLATGTCRATTFSVIDEVARVSIPTPVVITYNTKSEPTATPHR